jgi:hypothetical protein
MLVWDEARSREQEEGSFVDQEAATFESGLKNTLRSSPFEVLIVELSSKVSLYPGDLGASLGPINRGTFSGIVPCRLHRVEP